MSAIFYQIFIFLQMALSPIKQNVLLSSYLRRISTERNERQFRLEIATKLIRHETIFNFLMNNSVAII